MKTPLAVFTLALGSAFAISLPGLAHAQSPAPSAAPVASVAPVASPAAAPVASPSMVAAASAAPTSDQAEPVKQKILDKYDLNHNGVLDPDEKAAFDRDRMIRKADRLRKYDKNGDGKLDDDERAVMRADMEKAKEQEKAPQKQ